MPTIVNITIEPEGPNPSIKIMNIVGELDESNLHEFEAALNPVVEDMTNKLIVLKLDELQFLSSKIIGYLASVYNKLSADGRRIVLAGCNKTIDDILSIVGMNQMITCYKSLEEAISQLPNSQL
jgi:anti-anti-sigma factor